MEDLALPGNQGQIVNPLVALLLRPLTGSRFSPVLQAIGGSTCDGRKRAACLLAAGHCVRGWLIGSPEAWPREHPSNHTASSSLLV